MKKKIKAPFRVRLLDQESGTTKREEVIDRHDICRLRMAMRCRDASRHQTMLALSRVVANGTSRMFNVFNADPSCELHHDLNNW